MSISLPKIRIPEVPCVFPTPGDEGPRGKVMTFLYSRECFKSQVVRIYLEEKGIPYSILHIDTTAAENLQPDIVTLNHSGETPVLVDGDDVRTGALGIIHHFDQCGQRLGGSIVDHLVSAEWMNKLIPHVSDEILAYASMPRSKARSLLKFKRMVCVENMAKHPALTSAYGTILTKYQTLDGHVCAGMAAEVARKKLGQVLEEAERHLASSGWTFLAGSDISVADVALAVLLAKAHRLGLHGEYFKKGKAVYEYWRKWRTRPSFRKTLGFAANASALATTTGSSVAVQARLLVPMGMNGVW